MPTNRSRPKSPKSSKQSTRATQRLTDLQAVQQLLEGATTRLKGEQLSVSEYVRLLQLRRDMESEQIREVRVTWVDPSSADIVANR